MEVTSLSYGRTRLGLQQVIVSLGDLLESSPNISNKTVTVAVMRPGHRNKSHLAATCMLPRICLLGRNRLEATAQRSATEAAAERLEQMPQNRVCVEMGPPIQRQEEISHKSETEQNTQLGAVTANTNQ